MWEERFQNDLYSINNSISYADQRVFTPTFNALRTQKLL